MSEMITIFCLSIFIYSLTFVGYSVADRGGFTKIDVKIGMGKEAAPGRKPQQLNTCHAYGDGSDIVKRIWPEFYKENK